MFKPNKNQILIIIAVLAIAVTGVLVFANSPAGANKFSFLNLSFLGASPDTVAKQSVDYLNKNVLQAGQTATLVSSSKESGVIKMKIKIADKEYDSYATLDGKLLFPEAFTVAPSAATAQGDTNAGQPTASVTPANVTKVDKTMLEAYVVSSCPFGLQVQRALANAISSAPALAQYVKVRYLGAVAASGKTITAMHGQEEADENLRQICLREEQQSKYWNYVSCYMKKSTGTAANGMPYGDTKTCQATAGIDTAKLNACVADTSRGIAYAKEDFDIAAKHNDTPACKADPSKCPVAGSPTLILNGTVISEDQFGGRSADAMRNIVCSSSSAAPAFCNTKLETTPATTSFSLASTAPTNATAAANPNCAPVAN